MTTLKERVDLEDLLELLPELKCPISQEIFRDPVVAADGHTYERAEIERWLGKGKQSSPMTNDKLQHMSLVPNIVVRSIIQEHASRVALLKPKVDLVQRVLETLPTDKYLMQKFGTSWLAERQKRRSVQVQTEPLEMFKAFEQLVKAVSMAQSACLAALACVYGWALLLLAAAKGPCSLMLEAALDANGRLASWLRASGAGAAAWMCSAAVFFCASGWRVVMLLGALVWSSAAAIAESEWLRSSLAYAMAPVGVGLRTAAELGNETWRVLAQRCLKRVILSGEAAQPPPPPISDVDRRRAARMQEEDRRRRARIVGAAFSREMPKLAPFPQAQAHFLNGKYCEALKIFQKLPDADAQYYVGYVLARGVHSCSATTRTKEEQERGLAMIQRGVKSNSPLARLFLAFLHEEGIDVELDSQKALHHIEFAAQRGHPYARWTLGTYYEDGHLVEKDLQKALDLFLKASDQNFSPAQYSLAHYYEKGILVQRDNIRAMYLYFLAGDQGLERAASAALWIRETKECTMVHLVCRS